MPRPSRDQVVVITGASSGIGRETAIEFALRGASIVLAARNQEALDEVATEVERLGGRSRVVLTDVAEWDQVNRLARESADHFGRIDTWVNNAAVIEHATVERMAIDEIERIIRVNLLGQIYGVKAVLPHLLRQEQGTIINVASTFAVRSAPLVSAYCASKHGIKGFTEALRMELAYEHPGVSVTLVLPASINTPFFAHSRSKLGVMPMPIPPVYEPRTVAMAIVHAAEHPRRDIYVGGNGKLAAVVEAITPSLLDWYMVNGGRMFDAQKADQPDDGQDNLFQPLPGTGSTTGQFGNIAKSNSLYTRYVELHPIRQRILATAVTLGALALARRFGR
jgi:short-subunit dehydrogenase